MNRKLLGLGIVIAGGALVAIAGSSLAEQAAAPGAANPVDVNVPAGVAAKANAPTPSAKATKKASIGKGRRP